MATETARKPEASIYDSDVLLFSVGPWVYTAHVALEAPMFEGRPALGTVNRADRTITLDPALCFDARVETLFHELAHAWFYAVDVAGIEQQCDLWAAMTASAMRDIENQGGMAAIAAMKPCDPLKFTKRESWWPWRSLEKPQLKPSKK